MNRSLDSTASGSSSPDSFAGVIGLGVDLVDVERINAALRRTSGLATRLFTDAERAYCQAGARPAERFAARFAAKEAAMKALGVGLGTVGWHDLEVIRDESGAPGLVVTGRAATRADILGGTRWLVSLTHTATLAEAVVLLVR